MHRVARVLAVLCFVLAVIVFSLADGLRRWYSGIFFLVVGTVMLAGGRRQRSPTDN